MRTTIRVACILTAALLAAVAAVGTAAGETAARLPTVFAGVASVSGLLEHLDSYPSVSPTSEPFYVSFAEGDSTFAPQTINARSAPYYPGDTVAGLGALLCTAGLPPACGLPGYPLQAVATPQHPTASVGFSPEAGPTAGSPLGATALSGVAHADASGVGTVSEVSGLDEPQGGSSSQIAALRRQMALVVGHAVGSSNAVVHVGAIRAATTQRFDAHGVLVTTAEVQDSDVSLLGGVIHIASITASSISTSNGGAVHTHTDNAALTGVTVAGVRATIDDKGVTVGGGNVIPGSVVTALNSGLQQALSAMGVTVHFIGGTTGGAVLPQACTKGEADGLQLHASQSLTELPTIGAVYYDNIAIGAACTTVTVGAPPVAELPPTVSQNLSQGVTSPETAASPAAAPTADGGTGGTGGGASPPLAASTAPARVSSPSLAIGLSQPGRRAPSLEAELATKVVAHRLTLLYAIFGLVSIAALLGAKPLTRPRLPRGQ